MQLKQNNMKRILILAAATMMTIINVSAQRIGCVRVETETRASNLQQLPNPYHFDPEKIYRQPVVLITFNDTEFSMGDPVAYYNRLFNEEGFNEGVGRGCVADYFREQSEGRLNLQFDIYGPVKVDETAGGRNNLQTYGMFTMQKAIQKLAETEETDFAIYDWNGDSLVNQVVFVAAGFSGQQKDGYIWPNSGYFWEDAPGGMLCNFSSISSEIWEDNKRCGIGTIIHEFCHCLGLPDVYPVNNAGYSVVDEWDLMDGGNYTNNGWCPPNLSAMEKMYLGWSTPVELTEPTTIEGMKPLSDGGETYIIRSSGNSNEFYLLENRRQKGWDYGCPGNGLLIFHVDYKKYNWCENDVNTIKNHFRYDLFHADGKDYQSWDLNGDGKDKNKWTMENSLRSRYLSTSTYPYTDPTTEETNASLTDDSSPAATLFTANAEGKKLMSKAITNIQIDDDGNVSFDFMKTDDTGVSEIISDRKTSIVGWYDLNGRQLHSQPHHSGIYIVRYNNGTKKKYFLQVK